MCEGEVGMCKKMTEKHDERERQRESGLERARARGRGMCC